MVTHISTLCSELLLYIVNIESPIGFANLFFTANCECVYKKLELTIDRIKQV